ncbi:MAG TPA: pentapeptide repeat-containing protein, partial [Lentzea sp.]
LGVIVFVPRQVQLQINLRTSLMQLFGGLLIVAAAAEAWRQFNAHRDGQIIDRFSRAVEHLASENTDIRIGGLHMLEGIANGSPKIRRHVQITIGSFVRNRVPCDVGRPLGQIDESLPRLRTRAPDVQTALAILSRPPDAAELSLSRVDLRSLDLEDRQLSGSDFSRCNLAGAGLRGTRLDECDFHATDLRQADLRGASLRKASLRNAYLEGADLRDADLTEADLRGADMRALNLDQARLDGAHVDAKTIWPPGFARFGVSASLFSD